MATAKKTKKVVEAEGVAHIQATFNNTIVTLTDRMGNVVSWSSAGSAGLGSGRRVTRSPTSSRRAG